VPADYICALNEYGIRNDKGMRNELNFGAYTFKAPAIFTHKEPVKQRFVFLLDTSIYAIESGFYHQVLTSLKTCLSSIP
jgi:hypothetical protein